jgi:carbamoyl-phosphate synthase large subunit
MKLNVLVTAPGGALASGIVKALRLTPFEFRLITASGFPWGAALYAADRGVIVPQTADDSYIPAIKRICAEERIDAVFAGSAHEALLLSHVRDEIHHETGATVMVSDTDTIMVGYDRWLSVRFLKAGGFNYPETVQAGDRNAVVRMVGRFGYPVVVKSRMGFNAGGLVVAGDEETLEFAIRRPKGLLVQEYLPNNDGEYAVGLFIKRDGVIGGAICMRRVDASGSMVVMEAADAPEVGAEAGRVAAAVRPAGPCTVRIRMTDRGPVTFAVEPYCSAETGARAAFGFNEVEAAIRHYLLGEDVGPVCGREGMFVRYYDEVLVHLEGPRSKGAGAPREAEHVMPPEVQKAPLA